MGIIRILLALAVVISHTGSFFGFTFLDGKTAVQCFFIISGFYMSFILNEKSSYRTSYKLFISNRMLRLYPAYLIVLGLSFIFTLLTDNQQILAHVGHTNVLTKIYLVATNIFIIGQDSSFFMALDANGALNLTSDFSQSNPMVFSMLLCPPAWSLSLELLFYSIVPFLARRRLLILLLLFSISIALRLVIYHQGMFYDPWTYRFFPTELALFLAGMFSFRFYLYLKSKDFFSIQKSMIWVLFLGSVLLFNYIPLYFDLKQCLLYLLLFMSMPFIFEASNKLRFDRFLGELSYPIYISHIFIIAYAVPIFNRFIGLKQYNDLWYVLLTLIFSILLYYIVIRPIETFREKRVLSASENER